VSRGYVSRRRRQRKSQRHSSFHDGVQRWIAELIEHLPLKIRFVETIVVEQLANRHRSIDTYLHPIACDEKRHRIFVHRRLDIIRSG